MYKISKVYLDAKASDLDLILLFFLILRILLKDYVIFDPTDPDTLIDYEEPEDQFRVVITTRNLLKFSLHFELVLQTDGTYKSIELIY